MTTSGPRLGSLRTTAAVAGVVAVFAVAAACSESTAAPPPTTSATTDALAELCAAAEEQRPEVQRLAGHYCTHIGPISELRETLLLTWPTTEELDVYVEAVCAPEFQAITRDDAELAIALEVRRRVIEDPALGRLWLDRGLLAEYGREELEDGQFLLNVTVDEVALGQIVDAEMALLGAIESDLDAICT